MHNENSTLVEQIKICSDFNSWNQRGPKLLYTVGAVLLTCFVVGAAFLIYGMVHVTADSRAVNPIVNSLRALQSLQVPLLMTEHAAYRLSVATDVSEATNLASLMQNQIFKLSTVVDQLNVVNLAMGASVSDALILPRQQWSQMIDIASVNASTSIPYLLSMSAIYSTQLLYSELIMGWFVTESNAATDVWIRDVGNLGLLLEGAFIFMGCALSANLLMAGARTARYRDLAEHAMAIKARFLTLISVLFCCVMLLCMQHEMRTPLNGVLGPLQLLNDSLTASEHQPLVRASITATEVLLSMVNNLLDYRLLDDDVSGSGPSQRVVSVDLYSLLLDIEAMIRPAMFAKGINYRQLYHNEYLGNAHDNTNGPRWPSGLLVDRAALVQIMMNLLSNAHKFTPATGYVTVVTTLLQIYPAEKGHSNRNFLSATSDRESISIEMEAVRVVTPGFAVEMARFRIEIIDTGVGIPPTQLKTVFEVFSGDSDITTRAFDGLGLGLAISSKLATKKLGSRITASSVPGQGSTFSFELVLPVDSESHCSSELSPISPLGLVMTPLMGLASQGSPSYPHSSSALDWASTPCDDATACVRMSLEAAYEDTAAISAINAIGLVSVMPRPEPALLIQVHPTDVDVAFLDPVKVAVCYGAEMAALNTTSRLTANAFGLLATVVASKSVVAKHSGHTKDTAVGLICSDTAAAEVVMSASILPVARVPSPQPAIGNQDSVLPLARARTTSLPRLDVTSPLMVERSGRPSVALPVGVPRPGLTSPMRVPRSSALTPASRRLGATPPVQFMLDSTPPISTTVSRRASVSAVTPMSEISMLDAALPPLRILLVEDNLVNQRFALTLLGKMGHTVMLAENGQEAVDKWRATLANLPAVLPFDICLMDLSMPVLDGYEATTKIRALEKSMAEAGHQVIPLPIVAVSANSIAAKPKCLAVGMQAYIAKPMRKSDLVEVMLTFGCGRLSPAVLQAARILVSDSRVESSCPEYIGSQLRILLVEDQQTNNRFSLELLEKLGHSVVLAQHGLEAVDKFRATLYVPGPVDASVPTSGMVPAASPDSIQTQATVSTAIKSVVNSVAKNVSNAASPDSLTSISGPFDVCLMDLVLPIMDGYMVATTIRSLEKAYIAQVGHLATPMPIVALSVSPIEALERCLVTGMQGCIAKPFLLTELVQQLSTLGCLRTQLLTSQPTNTIESQSPEIGFSPLHILVVEDNMIDHQFLFGLLKKLGHSAVLAENGKDAVDKWRATISESVLLKTMGSCRSIDTKITPGTARRFDLCLMNMSMSVMNGFETASDVRCVEQSLVLAGQLITPLSIVAVGVDFIVHKAQCLALGIHAFISKPILETELVHNLQPFGGQRQQLSAATISPMTPLVIPIINTASCNIVSPKTPAGLLSPRGLMSPLSMAFAGESVQFPLTSRQALAIQQQRMHTPTAGSSKRRGLASIKLSAFSEATEDCVNHADIDPCTTAAK